MNVIHIKEPKLFALRMKRAEQLNNRIAALTNKGGRGELTPTEWYTLQQERESLTDVCADIGKMVAQWYFAQDEPNALDALCFTADRDDTDDPRNWTGVR